jgi:hypothetical protein
LDWATWYADYVDPLTPTPDRPEFVESPKSTPVDELDLTRRTRPIVQRLGVKNTDELFAVEKAEFDKICDRWSSREWNEVCRVLEGLGYDVPDYHDW